MKISDLTTQMARVKNNKTEKQAKVSRVLTFSCVDGPGNRLVLFLQGCNFDCITCHNPTQSIIVTIVVTALAAVQAVL